MLSKGHLFKPGLWHVLLFLNACFIIPLTLHPLRLLLPLPNERYCFSFCPLSSPASCDLATPSLLFPSKPQRILCTKNTHRKVHFVCLAPPTCHAVPPRSNRFNMCIESILMTLPRIGSTAVSSAPRCPVSGCSRDPPPIACAIDIEIHREYKPHRPK